jgi:hypothetical protein
VGSNPRNVYEHSLALTNTNVPLTEDRDWHPVVDAGFQPTDHAPGSPAKIEVMQRRLSDGYPLFHQLDRQSYEGYDCNTIGAMPCPQGVGGVASEFSETLNKMENRDDE